MRGKTRHVAFSAVALSLLLTACGSRLPYDKVLAENAQLGNNSASQSADGQTGAANIAGSGNTGGSAQTGSSTGASNNSVAANPSQTSGPAGGVGTKVSTPATAASPNSAGTASCTGAPTLSTVNIGEIGSDSGLLGTIVGYMRQGAEIWAAYINQHGGLGCHKVNLITADDGGDPSTALSEAQTMVQQDHVLALVSMADPLSLPTIAPYLQQAGVPVVGGVLVESQWYTNPDLFPQGSAFRVTVDGSVKAGIDQGATKVGVIACVELALICSNAANDLQQDTAAMGGQFVYSASVSLAQPDFTSQCLGAKAAGVTNLFLSLEPNSDIRLIGDCANQNYHPTFSTLGFALIPELINTPNANGMVTASGVFPFSAVSPATAQFDQAVQQATGGPPNSGLFAAAWVAGLVLQTAANELPATNPTPADILAGLYRIKNDNFGGLTSPITYTKGQPAVSPTCYWPIDVKSGAAVAPLGLQSQCLPSGVG